jgi:hypothetical protein
MVYGIVTGAKQLVITCLAVTGVIMVYNLLVKRFDRNNKTGLWVC